MGKTLRECLQEAKDIVDKLWVDARATYTQENIEILQANMDTLKVCAEAWQIRAETRQHSYKRISRGDMGRSYEDQIEHNCLLDRLAQIKGEPVNNIEGYLKEARRFQEELALLYQQTARTVPRPKL